MTKEEARAVVQVLTLSVKALATAAEAMTSVVKLVSAGLKNDSEEEA